MNFKKRKHEQRNVNASISVVFKLSIINYINKEHIE